MNFRIQASSPKCTRIFDEDDESLFDAIQTVFPLETEYVIMEWNHIYIPLGYKYDISIMIDDILNMLRKIRSTNISDLKIAWASNTFSNKWNINWKEDKIWLRSEWGNVIGNTEKLLTESGDIVMNKIEFMYEWRRVLYNLINALENSGYKKEKIVNMEFLINEYNMIGVDGALYK